MKTRETLTRDQIVRAAIELLDAEGLEGLNMRALGKRLGSAATAVYWHVGSKENLVGLASDRAWLEIELPDLEAVDWRTAATAMASSLYAMLGRHPWLLQAFGSFLLYGPGKARHDDHGLAIFETAGFSEEQADQAFTAVFTFVLGNALGQAATASLTRKFSRAGEDGEEVMRAGLVHAREIASRYPRLRSRLDTAASGYAAAPEQAFEFGLQAVVDGLEARLVDQGGVRAQPPG